MPNNVRKTPIEALTSRYLMIIRDEVNFEERATIKFTYAWIALFASIAFIIIFILAFFLVTTVLAQSYNPRYAEGQQLKRILALQDSVAELERTIELADQKRSILDAILRGEMEPVELEEPDTSEKVTANLEIDSPVDSLMRKQFEETDLGTSASAQKIKEDMQSIFFFRPIEGVLSGKFDPKDGHYGVDVVAAKDEPIKSVADGSVILSSWTQDGGYVLAVQHKNQLISFYKHNSALYKKTGDQVRAGDIIAIVGNSGEQSEGPHLHFELWYDGQPVNPLAFVHFE